MRRTPTALTVVAIMAAASSSAAAAIRGSSDADELAGAVLGGPVTGAALVGANPSGTTDPRPAGVGDSPLAGFPTQGGDFTILSTGPVASADDANTSDASGYEHYFHAPFGGDAYDPVRLGIPVAVPAGADCLALDYRFLSEEYPEFVGASANDGFVLELDRSTWEVDQTGPAQATVTAPDDFASPAGYDWVGASTVGMDAAEAAGTTYDGASSLLTARVAVSPGAHTVYASLWDVDGYGRDSTVFLDNLRLTSDPGCSGLTAPPGGPGAGAGPGPGSGPGGRASARRPRVTPGAMKVGTVCTINPADVDPETLPFCGGTWDAWGRFVADPSSGTVALPRGTGAGRMIRLGSVSYSLAAGEAAEVTIPFDRALRPLVRASRKVKVRLFNVNDLDGAVEESRFTVRPQPPPGRG